MTQKRVISFDDFRLNIQKYEDEAATGPVLIGEGKIEHLVMMSADEYHRLMKNYREHIFTADLSEDDLASIANTEIPQECYTVDDELNKMK